ncbi:Rieske (2Fe-2S) protein [Pseudomonas zhanjiangensis]|uniref:Rieske (2Fe-2S) protein n=1 Tax=Pseudomonas zhanjiangensis TaxID=3239015 RepID=A0ABV3YXA5_9PSED
MIRLCATDELAEGHSRGFEIAGGKLLAVRKDGRVFVYRNRCPHRGIPLEWLPDQFLDHSASLIQCATHGALFLIDSGECVAGPCAGQSLEALSCAENDGAIWVESPPAAL